LIADLRPAMRIKDYEEQEALSYALNKVCLLCTKGNCAECTVYSLRSQLELPHDLSYTGATDPISLPDNFSFQTSINQLTCHNTYHAAREEDLYHISLPKIGEICQLSAAKMEYCIRKQRFQILFDL